MGGILLHDVIRNLTSSFIIIVALLALLVVSAQVIFGATPPAVWMSSDYRAGDFKLVHGRSAADILVSPADFKVVQSRR